MITILKWNRYDYYTVMKLFKKKIKIYSSCYIAMIQIYKYTNIGKYETLTTLRCSGTKRLLTSWLLIFRHEERETQFLLCWLFLHRPQSTPQLDWPGPESNLNWHIFSKITKFSAHRFRAWHHSHPRPFPICFFYYNICDCAWTWTVLNVYAPALIAE